MKIELPPFDGDNQVSVTKTEKEQSPKNGVEVVNVKIPSLEMKMKQSKKVQLIWLWQGNRY